MDQQHLPPAQTAAAPQIEAAPPEGLWEQAAYGNSFLAEQVQSGAATQGLWADLAGWFSGGEEAPKVARKGIGEAASQIDRKMAAEELRGKFHVGEGSEEGKAGVSQEEYDEIVGLYSDIRMGRSQLKLNPGDLPPEEAAAFRAGTMNDLSTLMQTPSGRALLKDLARGNNGHTTTLGPTTGSPDTNASLPGLNPGDMDDRWKLHHALHNGQGADTTVNYNPGQISHTPHDGDIRSDIALYHELTHAWHNGHGQNAEGSVPGQDGASVGLEEFETVGLGRWADQPYTENRYRAERAKMGEKVGPRTTYGGTKPEDHQL